MRRHGLDWDTYKNKAYTVNDQILYPAQAKVDSFRLIYHVVVAGIDGSGGHIASIEDPGELDWRDSSGFIAIGTGQEHAEYVFRVAGYDENWDFNKALSLVYEAKKRSENAPDIGEQTVMCVVLPAKKIKVLQPGPMKILDDAYRAMIGTRHQVAQQYYDTVSNQVGDLGKTLLN